MSEVRTDGGAAPARPGSGAMFDRIARRYDLLNRVISLGMDQRWRRRTIAALALAPGARVLDLASGTADLAIRAARACPGARVVALDPSREMLAIAQRKIARAGVADRVSLERGDAQALPFADRAFDAVCMGFGIRNVPDRTRALREIARVTRPGGRIAILELSEPRRGVLAPLARLHIRRVVPRLGAWLSGAREYRYLERSVAAFPPPGEFAAMMREAEIAVAAVHAMSLGACHLYVGEPARPAEAAA